MARKPTPPGWVVPPVEDLERLVVEAMQALARGEANEGQQTMALKWIVDRVCATYDQSFRDTDRETAFAEGRRFVGLTIVKAVKANVAATRGYDGGREQPG